MMMRHSHKYHDTQNQITGIIKVCGAGRVKLTDKHGLISSQVSLLSEFHNVFNSR